ncbi:hypothetical protein JCM17844_00900 [Iodidimonas gelatinilytica]|uniref:Uncharacterized protein n=1 Tax=Iodidimonas gelatinilytica TaxID=1236966 RepID=A0A5A7MMU0_9PROT|nr:hypothetical protein JCM17844_00900 [Iodidimonas gelatinilytica]
MVDQLSILLGVFGILYIVFWLVKNDGAKSIQDQKGLIKMRANPERKPLNMAAKHTQKRSHKVRH